MRNKAMYIPMMVVAIVATAAAVLYMSDRRSKGEPVDIATLFKLVSFSGLAAGGIVFALQTDIVSDAVATVTEGAQDMFVGKPSF